MLRGLDESLLGQGYAISLGIVKFLPEGCETKRNVTETIKRTMTGPNEVVSGGMKQSEIDDKEKEIVYEFKDLFVGLGRAQGFDPIHIEIDKTVRSVQQKRRPNPLKYVERFESLQLKESSPDL